MNDKIDRSFITILHCEFREIVIDENSAERDMLIKINDEEGEIREIVVSRDNTNVINKALQFDLYEDIEIEFQVKFIKEIDNIYRRYSRNSLTSSNNYERDAIKLEVLDIRPINESIYNNETEQMTITENYVFGKLRYKQAKDSAKEDSKYTLLYDEIVNRDDGSVKIISHYIKVDFNKIRLIEKLTNINGHPSIELKFKIHLSKNGPYVELVDANLL